MNAKDNMWIKVGEIDPGKYFFTPFLLGIVIIIGVGCIACCCRAGRWSKRAP